MNGIGWYAPPCGWLTSRCVAAAPLTRTACVRISFLRQAGVPRHVSDTLCSALPPSVGSWTVSLCARRGSCRREHTRVCRTTGASVRRPPLGPVRLSRPQTAPSRPGAQRGEGRNWVITWQVEQEVTAPGTGSGARDSHCILPGSPTLPPESPPSHNALSRRTGAASSRVAVVSAAPRTRPSHEQELRADAESGPNQGPRARSNSRSQGLCPAPGSGQLSPQP